MGSNSRDVECPNCGREYTLIGSHWTGSKCAHPDLTAEQEQLCEGMMMGDGSLNSNGKNPYIRMSSTRREFLEEIDEVMGIFSTGVRVEKTVEEAVAHERERDDKKFDVNFDNYRTVYMLRTRSHPSFKKYQNWYSTGTRRYGEDIELTPLSTKYWYASDGSVNWMRGSPKIQISCASESDRPEFIADLFRDVGFDAKWNRHMVYFNKRDSRDLIDWMGTPVRGYEYKWEVDDEDRYHDHKP